MIGSPGEAMARMSHLSETVLPPLLLAYAVYALAKFIFFFALSYGSRRRALDKAYAGRASATKRADAGLLAFSIFLAALIEMRGADPVSFLGGLLIGMSLIQLYFHRFSVPLAPEQEPGEPRSPIKWISYAIQAAPQRTWKELLVISVLLVLSSVQILSAK